MEQEVDPEMIEQDLFERKDLSQLREEPVMSKPEVGSRVASPFSAAW